MSIILLKISSILLIIISLVYNIKHEVTIMAKLLKSKKSKIYSLCLFFSFLFLTICTKSSFLYPINNWTDANCFFTIGRGMLDGKVYYLDLFDQKGPLLFFYHTIAAMISYKSFLGVFIIEVVSFSFFLYYTYKLLNIFVKEKTAIYSLPIISFLILTLPAFSHGDSAEEFCLPFLMFSIYSLVKFLKENKKYPSYKMVFINGIIAGAVMTIKYTMLGYWFAFMMCLFFYMIKRKEVKRSFISCLVFLLGMFIPLLPWLIYFAYHNALDEFIFSYVTFNIKYYPNNKPLLLRLITVISKPARFFATNLGIGIPFFFGLLILWFDKLILKTKEQKLIITTTFIFLAIGVFFGGVSFRYYYLILTPFSIFGIIVLAKWIEEKYQVHKNINSDAYLTIITTILLALAFYASSNTSMIKPLVEKEDTVQYQFAEIINKKKNPTILNYHFLDGGFYMASVTQPTTKYFQKQNISDDLFPKITEEQDKLIKNKKVDFVITRTKINRYENIKFTKYLKRNYREIYHKNEDYEEKRFRYTLWEKK